MRKRKSDESKIKEGLGTGSGKDYQPFDNALSFASMGGHKRIPGIKIDRTHHYFSDLEKKYLFPFEFADNVTDIREQYPLFPLTETQEIASSLNILHPKDHEMKQHVMRTDYRISFKNSNDMIFTVKLSDQLTNRVIQKFEIERVFWSRRNIRWFILTEKELDPIIFNNIDQLRENFHNETTHLKPFTETLKSEKNKKNETIGTIIAEISRVLKITNAAGRKLFLYLLARKRVRFALHKPFNLQMKISEFDFRDL